MAIAGRGDEQAKGCDQSQCPAYEASIRLILSVGDPSEPVLALSPSASAAARVPVRTGSSLRKFVIGSGIAAATAPLGVLAVAVSNGALLTQLISRDGGGTVAPSGSPVPRPIVTAPTERPTDGSESAQALPPTPVVATVPATSAPATALIVRVQPRPLQRQTP